MTDTLGMAKARATALLKALELEARNYSPISDYIAALEDRLAFEQEKQVVNGRGACLNWTVIVVVSLLVGFVAGKLM